MSLCGTFRTNCTELFMSVLIHPSAAAQQASVLICQQGGEGLTGSSDRSLVPNEEPHSGSEVCFSTMHSKMATLRPVIGDMREAHLLNSLQEFRACQQCQAQLLPILALATRDNIVNGRKAQFLMIRMPVWRIQERLCSTKG